jgi:hypothetical protein
LPAACIYLNGRKPNPRDSAFGDVYTVLVPPVPLQSGSIMAFHFTIWRLFAVKIFQHAHLIFDMTKGGALSTGDFAVQCPH